MKEKSRFVEDILSNEETMEPPAELASIPFIEAIYPWITVARKKLQEKAGNRLSLLEKEAQVAQEKFLVQRWSDMATPSFYLELEIKKLQDSLRGNTSRERYLDFVQRSLLDKDVLRAFFQEYQALAEKVAIAMELWLEETCKFLEHLESDLPELEKVFNKGEHLGKVASFNLNAGDVHQGGKSVRILQFPSGTKIVYKPKDLGIIKVFNEFIEELNKIGLSPPLKAYVVLPKEDYGWEECVEHKPCENLVQADAYFQRAGMLLSLLFLLEGKDAHFENIIASGEFPILIDLETLLHPTFPDYKTQGVDDIFIHSVLTTGLLPSFESGKERGITSDLSGLGSKKESVIKTTAWKNINTDEMHYGDEEAVSSLSASQLMCQEKRIGAEDHVEAIVIGFEKIYSLLQANRSFFLAWLERLAIHPVRFVMRATRVYYLLLRRLHTPQILLDEELRDQEIKILERLWSDRGKEPVASIIDEEKTALLQGDIPSYQSLPKSRDLFSGSKNLSVNFFNLSTYEVVKKRIERMNDKENRQQQIYIKYAFQAKKREMHVEETTKVISRGNNEVYTDEQVLERAKLVALTLRESAFIGEDGNLGWLSLHPNANTGFYSFSPLDNNLYSGKTGIALFFAALFALSKDTKWKEEAFAILKELREFIENAKGKNLSLLLGGLGMSGAGGIVYALFHIGKLLASEELMKEALDLIEEIEVKEIQKDQTFDIIGGSAGFILVLLSLYKECKQEKLLELATLCGTHLCENALDQGEDSVAWKNPIGEPYLGFAHGTAGIGYALLKLHELVPQEKFLKTAKSAQNFERRYYSEKEKNWPITPTKGEFWASWCHGSIGIGLSRLGGLPDSVAHEEFECALNSSLKALEKEKTGLSLCCGILGRLEFLLEASKKKKDAQIDKTLRKTVSSLLHHLDGQKDPVLAQTNEFDDPGFMKGASGLGYTLLRLIDKEKKLPQVLLFS